MKKEKRYMVIACFVSSIRDNWEIIDFNLTMDEAKRVMSIYKARSSKGPTSGWTLDLMADGYSAIKIIEQSELI